MPTQKPTAAGITAPLPISAPCSIAGISRLQIDAATMTPAAKPVNARCTGTPSDLFKKNTQPAPNIVPRNGSSIP